MRKFFVISFTLLLGAFFIFSCSKSKTQSETNATKTKKAIFQNFVLQDLDGNSVDLYKEFKDKNKIIIVDLFATWCGPCRMEIPGFVSLNNTYKDKVIVVGVSFDRGGDVNAIKKFASQMKMNYTILRGTQALAQYVQLRGIPRTFVLNPDFSIAKDMLGYHSKQEFEKLILDLSKKLGSII